MFVDMRQLDSSHLGVDFLDHFLEFALGHSLVVIRVPVEEELLVVLVRLDDLLDSCYDLSSRDIGEMLDKFSVSNDAISV